MFGNGPDESHVDPPHISFGGSTTMCSRERGFYTHAHPPVVCLMEMFVFDGSAVKHPQARPLPHQRPFKTAMGSASPPQYHSSSPSSHAPSATHTVRSPVCTPRRCTPGTSLPTSHRQSRREGPQNAGTATAASATLWRGDVVVAFVRRRDQPSSHQPSLCPQVLFAAPLRFGSFCLGCFSVFSALPNTFHFNSMFN